MRLFAALLAAMAQTMTAASAQAQVLANCLNYLTADAAYERVAEPYRQAKASASNAHQEMIRLVEIARRHALNRAKENHRKAERASKGGSAKPELDAARLKNQRNFRQAELAAETAFRQTEAHAKAAYNETVRNYDAEFQRSYFRYRNAIRAADSHNALQSAKSALRAARAALNDANTTRDHNKKTARSKFRLAVNDARDAYDFSVGRARSAQVTANKSAEQAYWNNVKEILAPATAAFNNAKRIAGRNYLQSKRAAKEAYNRSFFAEREAYQKALKAWEEAYIATYAEPGGRVRRKVSGYDRALVLKVARYERRKFCPAL